MKKSKYRRLKALSFILSVIMIICSIPMTAIAETIEPSANEEDDSYVYDVMESEEIELEATEVAQITEVESLREENVKHFKMPDGTYEMIVYGEAVHRKDTDGKWQDIDNNLELTAVKNVNMFASSDMRTTFASSFSVGQPLMTLSENGYSVSMSLVSDNINSDAEVMSISEPVAPAIQNATVRENNAKFDTISQAAEIDNKSSIKYQNVKANTDIEYVMSGNDIKENIIIKAKGTNYIYRFDLTLDGLVPELVNNTVILKDSESKETKYIIPEPYMYDADGNISYSVTYTLTNRGNGIYRLIVTADSSWINAEGRAFPVVVDPSLTTNTGFECSYVEENFPNITHSNLIALYLSQSKTAFIKANINFPDNIKVNEASLNMTYYYNGASGACLTELGVYAVPSAWDDSTLTYNNMPSLSRRIFDTTVSYSADEASTSPVPRKSVSFDITALADEWAINMPNHGVAIKYMNEDDTSEILMVAGLSPTIAQRPTISINYTSYAGGFYIQNVATGMYMDIETDDYGNALTESGAYAVQNEYSASDSQRWVIERVEYPSSYAGQTVIRSAYSGKYLGISYDDTVFLAQYDTIDDFNVWNLNWPPSAGGTYTFEFMPTIPDGYTVSVPSQNSGAGARILQQREEDMDSDECDEWKLWPVSYQSVVNAFYDKGYYVKNEENFSQSVIKIREYILTVSERFMKEIGLIISINSVQYYASPIDACKNNVNLSNINSAPCCEDNHTYRQNVLNDFQSNKPGTNTITNVLFSAHTITWDILEYNEEESNNYVPSNYDNRSCSWYNCIYIFTTTYTIGRDFDTKATIMHELSHQYGAPDHYHDTATQDENGKCKNFQKGCTTCSDDPRPEQCIMNYSRLSVENVEIIFCQDCKNDMKNHLNGHHLIP